MKRTALISALTIALVSGAVLADTAPPPAHLTFGEQIANWFGNIATRVRNLEQQHAGQRLDDLQKRVTALESEINDLKTQTAQAETDAQKAQASVEDMSTKKPAAPATANRHGSQR